MTVETTLAMFCPATTGRGVAANQRQNDSEAVRMESILTILFYSEKGHSVCTRGVAKNVVVKGQPSVSYVMEYLVDTRISSSIAQIESIAPRTAPRTSLLKSGLNRQQTYTGPGVWGACSAP
jgi:hypothetical protein